MDKVFVKVDYQILAGGAIRPTRIHWHDGRIWNIDKTLHACTSECDFKGIRYTVLIGSAEKYLYRLGSQWYVDSGYTIYEIGYRPLLGRILPV